MIYVNDDFLPEDDFKALQTYCNVEPFQMVQMDDKAFSVLPTPQHLIPLLQREGHELVMTFIRSAHKGFDTDWRIHADNIINGHKTARAGVLYISGDEVSANGTAFYEHSTHGKKLPEHTTEAEFNRLIKEDANDLTKWTQKDHIASHPNRLLIYNSQYFHSKFPAVIERGVRKVLVCFYAVKKYPHANCDEACYFHCTEGGNLKKPNCTINN